MDPKVLPDDGVRFISSNIKILPFLQPQNFRFETIHSQIIHNTLNPISQLIESFTTRSKVENLNLRGAPLWFRFNNSNRSVLGSRDGALANRAGEEKDLFRQLSLLWSASLSLIGRGAGDRRVSKGTSPLLCSASLSLVESNQTVPEGKEIQQKGHSANRQSEERVLISEVLVRNKDGE